MTKKQDSDDQAVGKLDCDVDLAARALARLQPWDLCNVIVRELDRRRLDKKGNPTDPDGLHHALTIGMWKLVGAPLNKEHAKIAEGVAAVGRGVRVRSVDADKSATLRELERLLEIEWSEIANGVEMLTRTLAKRFGRPVKKAGVEVALGKKGNRQRLEWLALACGIKTTENSIKSARRN